MKCELCGQQCTLLLHFIAQGREHIIYWCLDCDTFYFDGERVEPPSDAGALED